MYCIYPTQGLLEWSGSETTTTVPALTAEHLRIAVIPYLKAARSSVLQVLRQLVVEMRDASGAAPQQLKSFVMEQCAGMVCLAALRNSRLDVR